MPTLKSSTTAANALVGIWTVSLTAFIIATLYFARDVLMPLALAALLTFLLAPLVTRLERWLGRIGAVLLVVTLILAATGGVFTKFSETLEELKKDLPGATAPDITQVPESPRRQRNHSRAGRCRGPGHALSADAARRQWHVWHSRGGRAPLLRRAKRGSVGRVRNGHGCGARSDSCSRRR